MSFISKLFSIGKAGTSEIHPGTDDHYDENDLSDLYKACFEGDLNATQRILETTPFERVNRLEQNGSTALHAAVECGDLGIVRLLLHDYGVIRHLTDAQGRTANELATSEEMRRLFERPTSTGNRFCDTEESSTTFLAFVKEKRSRTNVGQPLNFKRVETYDSYGKVRERYMLDEFKKFHSLQRDPIYRFFTRKSRERKEQEQIQDLYSILDQSIRPSDTQYNKARVLVDAFVKTRQVEPLIRLFTLETPFYRFINGGRDTNQTYFKFLDSLKLSIAERAFQGICYRGLGITSNDLEIYRWAAEKKDRYLEVNTFCSSSLERDRAEFHAEANENKEQRQVVIVFDFPQSCSRAIRLKKVPGQSAWSDFEDEDEVLILPGTPFSVEKIDQSQSLTRIYMTHLNLDEELAKYLDILIDTQLEIWVLYSHYLAE